jgi:hypothetical protein
MPQCSVVVFVSDIKYTRVPVRKLYEIRILAQQRGIVLGWKKRDAKLLIWKFIIKLNQLQI